MGEINGIGHGSDHDWLYLGSTPFKTSSYTCKRCKAGFRHNYDDVPDIFEAMRRMKVPEKCTPPDAKEPR